MSGCSVGTSSAERIFSQISKYPKTPGALVKKPGGPWPLAAAPTPDLSDVKFHVSPWAARPTTSFDLETPAFSHASVKSLFAQIQKSGAVSFSLRLCCIE